MSLPWRSGTRSPCSWTVLHDRGEVLHVLRLSELVEGPVRRRVLPARQVVGGGARRRLRRDHRRQEERVDEVGGERGVGDPAREEEVVVAALEVPDVLAPVARLQDGDLRPERASGSRRSTSPRPAGRAGRASGPRSGRAGAVPAPRGRPRREAAAPGRGSRPPSRSGRPLLRNGGRRPGAAKPSPSAPKFTRAISVRLTAAQTARRTRASASAGRSTFRKRIAGAAPLERLREDRRAPEPGEVGEGEGVGHVDLARVDGGEEGLGVGVDLEEDAAERGRLRRVRDGPEEDLLGPDRVAAVERLGLEERPRPEEPSPALERDAAEGLRQQGREVRVGRLEAELDAPLARADLRAGRDVAHPAERARDGGAEQGVPSENVAPGRTGAETTRGSPSCRSGSEKRSGFGGPPSGEGWYGASYTCMSARAVTWSWISHGRVEARWERTPTRSVFGGRFGGGASSDPPRSGRSGARYLGFATKRPDYPPRAARAARADPGGARLQPSAARVLQPRRARAAHRDALPVRHHRRPPLLEGGEPRDVHDPGAVDPHEAVAPGAARRGRRASGASGGSSRPSGSGRSRPRPSPTRRSRPGGASRASPPSRRSARAAPRPAAPRPRGPTGRAASPPAGEGARAFARAASKRSFENGFRR